MSYGSSQDHARGYSRSRHGPRHHPYAPKRPRNLPHYAPKSTKRTGEVPSDDEDAPRAQRRRYLEKLRQAPDQEEETAGDAAVWENAHKERKAAEIIRKQAENEKSSSESERMDISSSEEDDNNESAPESSEAKLMQHMLGITSFDSSKGKAHYDTDMSGIRKKTKRKYRQYMNRKGGFNRPLSPVF